MSTRKPSSIIDIQTLDDTRPHFERALALLLIGLSIFGSVIAFHGGWKAMIAAPTITASLAGAGVQLGCTIVEWLYRSRRQSIPYLLALFFDMGTTIAGYGPIFYERLVFWLTPWIGVLSGPAAWGIIGGLALLLAWIPEGRLIND